MDKLSLQEIKSFYYRSNVFLGRRITINVIFVFITKTFVCKNRTFDFITETLGYRLERMKRNFLTWLFYLKCFYGVRRYVEIHPQPYLSQ